MLKVAVETRLCCCKVLDEQKMAMFWNQRRWQHRMKSLMPVSYFSAAASDNALVTYYCCKEVHIYIWKSLHVGVVVIFCIYLYILGGVTFTYVVSTTRCMSSFFWNAS